MIREVTRDDIPVCVDIIRKSFKTVADEFGFTIDNAPRFTAFATTEERLYWQMDNEPRLMFVYEQNGVICGYYSLLMQDNNECELNNLAVLPEYRHSGFGKRLLEHAYETAGNQGCKLINIGIVEENIRLRKWYEQNGAVHTGTKKFDFFPFTCGYMVKELYGANEITIKMNIVYRSGTKQDLDAICLLIQHAINEMESHGIYQWDDIYPVRKDFEEDIEKQSLYLAYLNENLVALYVISDESDEQYKNGQWRYDEKTAYILHRFCVSPLFQNQGIGKIVLHHVENQIKEMGYQSVRLDTFTENPFAQRLYLHNGYESRGYANWRKGKFDLMEKKL